MCWANIVTHSDEFSAFVLPPFFAETVYTCRGNWTFPKHTAMFSSIHKVDRSVAGAATPIQPRPICLFWRLVRCLYRRIVGQSLTARKSMNIEHPTFDGAHPNCRIQWCTPARPVQLQINAPAVFYLNKNGF